jgi:SAM-dependent methyltransferase
MTERTLNLGCGKDMWGTDRIDMYKTPATTKVWNVSEKKLPYKNETFDAIKAHSTLEHFKNPGMVADECYRVLKKGGKLFVRVDYAGYLPMFLFKTHEHNEILNKQYRGKGYGHEQGGGQALFSLCRESFRCIILKIQRKKIQICFSWKKQDSALDSETFAFPSWSDSS